MILYRLGGTESTLLFYYYLEHILKININYKLSEVLVQYLYSMGFYDKKITGDYFNFDYKKCIQSKVYNAYFSKLLDIIKNNNVLIGTGFHKDENVTIYMNDFKKFLNKDKIDYFVTKELIYNNIVNKNVLIIDNLGILMKQQYDNGNLNKCHIDFPNIKNINFLNPGYTMFNNGPDNSTLDTADKLCQQIDLIINDIDIVIISAGPYSVLLADHINNINKKEVICIGGDLSIYFGLITNRGLTHHKRYINEYFITVPTELKPVGYEKIEGGCYW